MLSSVVYTEFHPRPLTSLLKVVPVPPSHCPPKSFDITSLAAPHLLTPIESHPYKNHRGEGRTHHFPKVTKSQPPLCFHSLTDCPFFIPFVLTFIHVMGGWGHCSFRVLRPGRSVPPSQLSKMQMRLRDEHRRVYTNSSRFGAIYRRHAVFAAFSHFCELAVTICNARFGLRAEV